MTLKKALTSFAAMLAAAAVLAGCKGSPDTRDETDGSSGTSAATTEKLTDGDAEIHNFIMPEIGEKIAVITVKDYGEIKIKLFPEDAEKGVENFVGLADMKYYDETIFHRIIPNFMIQGGDPKGNGTGGNSIWGEFFDGGVSDNLYHFTGAVAYANRGAPYGGTATNGSQFYIVNTEEGDYSLGGYYRPDGSIYYYQDFEEAGYSLPKNVQEMYREKGGTPSLDGAYTVFGQVFEGMDIVREIANVETDPENNKPLVPVIMESVRIVEYEG